MSEKMREILFRGKCVDTGIWYEGGYIHLHKTTHCPIGDTERFPDNDIHQIVFERMTDWELPNQHLRADVIPETVGQFTGLTDKNGKKIFEGDVIRVGGDVYFCYWDEGNCEFGIRNKKESMGIAYVVCPCLEVIGNIHDNPELLKETANV